MLAKIYSAAVYGVDAYEVEIEVNGAGGDPNIGANCDLSRMVSRNKLLTWLNKWGCRIDLKHHRKEASDELREWYKQFGEKLPSVDAKLWELTDDELSACAKLFDSLASKRTSSQRAKTYVKGRSTAAAKILFA